MRAALCAVVVLFGFTSLGYAQDSQKSKVNPRWKPIEIPQIEASGFTARFGADQSNLWQTPDPSSLGQARRSWNDEPAFGLTISRPIQY